MDAIAADSSPDDALGGRQLVNRDPQAALQRSDDDDEFPDCEAELQPIQDEVYGAIRGINDPEHPYNLSQLHVVSRKGVTVSRLNELMVVGVEFRPTVPHCSLATLIGLCIRTKVSRLIPEAKLNVTVQPGSHLTDAAISKQLNDKERAAAALENPQLRETVERLLIEEHHD